MSFSFSNFFKSDKPKPSEVNIPKIEFGGGTKYASNNENDMYLDFEELGGFPFIKTIIIGRFNTATKRTGCELSFILKNEILKLQSDKNDIESTEIKNSKVYFTEIDFELNDEDLKKINNNLVNEIVYTFKNKKIHFLPIDL
ncbi:hypothetical protein [Lutibacter sp.]|uniref:hypothetical protein n=1 Tax=Lutibacter sp. TaxID=1925666 RepID=UPI0027336DFA|nr:hypothetical protein [Lutibacter sp.]MDP3313508.1 hypothetical protein [Lutibacter sp.]